MYYSFIKNHFQASKRGNATNTSQVHMACWWWSLNDRNASSNDATTTGTLISFFNHLRNAFPQTKDKDSRKQYVLNGSPFISHVQNNCCSLMLFEQTPAARWQKWLNTLNSCRIFFPPFACFTYVCTCVRFLQGHERKEWWVWINNDDNCIHIQWTDYARRKTFIRADLLLEQYLNCWIKTQHKYLESEWWPTYTDF